MKKCLLKFPWIKVPREDIPALKGLLGYWLKLVSRAAFRKGISAYCGYENAVEPGMWVGGIVGLKSILGVKDCKQVLQIMGSCKSWATSPIRWSQEPRFLPIGSRIGF